VYGFVLLGTILVLLTLTIIRAAVRAGDDTGTALDASERRDAAIEALRDIELEFQTGKLTDGEYQQMRRRLEREALQARDRVEGSSDAGGAGRAADTSAPAADTSASATDSLAAPRFCTSCGGSLDGKESFCPACGGKV